MDDIKKISIEENGKTRIVSADIVQEGDAWIAHLTYDGRREGDAPPITFASQSIAVTEVNEFLTLMSVICNSRLRTPS
jgi:hypothetical protein